MRWDVLVGERTTCADTQESRTEFPRDVTADEEPLARSATQIRGGRLDLTDPYVFVIGAGRSGTTLLLDLIGTHPDLARCNEKRYVWMYGAYWRPHDLRPASDATPAVRAHIRRWFTRARVRSGARMLVEKTPSNCLRIPMMAEIFPRARYVHLIRDGRAVAFSSVRAFLGENYVTDVDRRSGQRTSSQRLAFITQRLPEVLRHFHEGTLPLSALLPFAARKAEDLAQTLLASRPSLWGVRYPGIYGDRTAYTPLELAGIQWRESETRALADLATCVPPEQRVDVRYDDLLSQPREELCRIFDFIGVDAPTTVLDRVASQVRGSDQAWRRGLDAGEQARLLAHIGPLLCALGYATPEDLPWTVAPSRSRSLV